MDTQDHELPLLWIFSGIPVLSPTVKASVFVPLRTGGLRKLTMNWQNSFLRPRTPADGWDTPSARKRQSPALLDQFTEGKQISCWELRMIAKGLIFSKCTLVGVLTVTA